LRVAGRHTTGPAEWLRWLHKELASLEGDDFVAAVAMEVSVSPDVVRVRLAVAGHPLPILLRGNGEVGTVGHPGTLLGVVTPTVVEDEVWLNPVDRLV